MLRTKRLRRVLVLSAAVTAAWGQVARSYGNSEYDVSNNSTDLTAAATYTTGGTAGTGAGGATATSPPSTTNDVTFDSGITYSPAAFTINTSLSIGTLDNLDTTQSLSISNTGAAADTLTLNGGSNSVPGTNASDLLYVASSGTLTLTGGTGTTALGLAVASTGNLDIAGTSTISSIISGSSGLTKTGTGTLTLSAGNTFSGVVTINAGTLKLGVGGTTGSTALGAIANNVTVASGATLDLNSNEISNYTGTITISGTGVSNNGAITNSGTGSINNNGIGNIALGANASIGTSSGGRFDITGSITANGFTLTKIGSTYLADRSTTSTLTNLIIAAGTWEISTAVGMGVNAITTTDTVNSGGTLTFYNAPTATTYLPTLDMNGGTLTTGSGSDTLNGPIVLGANSTVSGSFTFGPLATITGTGNLATGSIESFAAAIDDAGSITNSGTTSIAGNIGSNVTSLTQSSGQLTLSGTNTYASTVTISAGVLEFVSTASMSGYPTLSSANAITVANGATLALGVGGTGYFSNSDIAGFLAGSNHVSLGTSSILGLDTTNAGGSFTLNDAVSGNLGLTKLGTGALILTATNTYSGTTLISAGVLRATDGATLPASSLLNIDGGVFETGVSFARTGGTAADNVEITGGTSGFSANGGNITVAIGTAASPTALTWGTAPFAPGTLDLNETTATGTLNFLNAINLNGAVRTVQVNATATGTAATLSGALTSTSGGLTKVGAGTLIITNTGNSYTGATTVSAGTLTFAGVGSLPTSSALALGGGTLSLLNNGNGSGGTISVPNSFAPVNNTTGTLNVGNNGSNTGNTVAFSGVLNNSGNATNGATVNFTGSNGYLVGFTGITLPSGTGNNTFLSPTSTSVTIAGPVTNPMSGFAVGNYDTLYLSGTSTGNSITGAISDSATGSSTLGGYTRVIVGNSGAPTWTLSGNSTYSGPTTVAAGSLILTGTLGNTPISVASGATFAPNPGSGAISAGTNAANALGATLTLNAGSTFSMVDGGIGTFNLQQGTTYGAASTALTLAGATLNFQVGSSGADELVVGAGAALVSGTNIINVSGLGSSLTLGGSYPLISANQGLAGTFQFPNNSTTETIGVGGTAYVLTLANSGSAETLNVSSTPALTWTGQNSGNGTANSSWDTTTTSTNFASATTPSSYTNGSAVLFQDANAVAASNVTNPTVTIQAAGVTPASVTFSNNAVTYTINNATGGTTGIGGTTSLVKNGAGTVILAGTNTYTGGTFINAGVLQVAATETAGTSGPLGASGTITLGGGTLQFSTANTFDYSLRFSTAANQAYNIDTNGQSVTFGSALTSSGGTLTKIGNGTLTLSTGNAVDTYSGATVINGGTLALTGTGNSSAGVLSGTPTITVNSGATLSLASTSNDVIGYTVGKEALVINDGTVTNNATGIRVTLQNPVTLVGGTLGGTSVGDASHGAYSLDNASGVVATSDASGNPAVISAAQISLQTSGTSFNVTQGPAAPLSDLTVSGAIVNYGSATDSLVKTGSGVMTLTGTNTYTGTTTISAGTFRVDGSITGTGALTVGSGATLGGGGSVAGATTVNGTITSGINALTSGLFSTAAETWDGGGNYLVKLAGSPSGSFAGNPGAGGTSSTWDQIKFTTLGVASTTGNPFAITLDYTGSGFNSTGFTIPIAYSTATTGTINGGTTLSPGLLTLATSGDTFPAGTSASNFALLENPNNSEIDLVYNPSSVPEPGSLALLGLASAGLLSRRRRRADARELAAPY